MFRRILGGLAVVAVGAICFFAEKFGHLKSGTPVIFFDTGDETSKVFLLRQNLVLDTEQASKYAFTVEQLNKEYLVEIRHPSGKKMICPEPVFVRKGDGRMCSTGLFTSRQLSCGPLSAKAVETGAARLQHLRPPTRRGFGLEFEFLARKMPEKFKREFKRSLEAEHGAARADFLANLNQTKYLGIKKCFTEAALHGSTRTCRRDSDCALQQFCSIAGTCDDRRNCKHNSDAMERRCPMSPTLWGWHWDSSIAPLSSWEAKSIGAGRGETDGIAFEVTSPKPPNALSGRKGFNSTYEVLALLRKIGIQAGPSSGFHVHVNVMNANAPGKALSTSRVAAVWAAYAKYQLVIDEMLSPSRPGVEWSQRLMLGDCKARRTSDGSDCSRNPCPCVRRIFNQMHKYFKMPRWMKILRGQRSALGFCNAALAMPGSSYPCNQRYPLQRYSQLNLVPLHRFGTIEFRAHSATYDPERIGRWVQFLVAFVEYYGNGKGYSQMQRFFSSKSADSDYQALRRAQRKATSSRLFKDLAGLVDNGTADYYASRVWEQGDPTCLGKFEPTTRYCRTSTAFAEVEPPFAEVDSPSSSLRGGSLPVQSVIETQPQANLSMSDGGEQRKVSVPVPIGAQEGSWLEALMPEGNVRTDLLTADSIRQGFHEFKYDWENEERLRSMFEENVSDVVSFEATNEEDSEESTLNGTGIKMVS